MAARNFKALLDEYSKLAAMYGWRGRVYSVVFELEELMDSLSRLLIDPAFYEEKVREMIKERAEEKQILSFLASVKNDVEDILKKPDIKKILELLQSRGSLFKNIEELREELNHLREEARGSKPRISVECLTEGEEGALSIFFENPTDFPIIVSIDSLKGAKLLKPSETFTLHPNSVESWSSRMLLEDSRIQVRFSYLIPGIDVKGFISTETQVMEPPEIEKLINKPIDPLRRLKEEYFKPIRRTGRFGDWEIIGYLGGGGYFHAFLAERAGLKAVLKIPKSVCEPKETPFGVEDIEFYEDRDAIREVEREASILQEVKRIRDEEGLLHLMDFYGSGIFRVRKKGGVIEVPYLAVQHCPKGSLRRVCLGDKSASVERLSLRDALLIALQVGKTLQVCYRRRAFVKHGDLKPENLLIDGEGRVIIADFQTATPIGRSTDELPIKGTARYFHPAPDDRADVYALGRILVDLISGLNAPEDSVPDEVKWLVELARPRGTRSPLRMDEFIRRLEVAWKRQAPPT
jgi:hypothetical protein